MKQTRKLLSSLIAATIALQGMIMPIASAATGDPAFSEQFTGYTSEHYDASTKAYTKGTVINGETQEGGIVLATTKEGFDWRTSSVKGVTGGSSAGTYISKSGYMAGCGYGAQKSSVLLDTKNKQIANIEQVKFKLWLSPGTNRNIWVELFVNEEENKSIRVGIDSTGAGFIDNVGGTDGKRITAPSTWRKGSGSSSANFTVTIDHSTNKVTVNAAAPNTNDWADYTFNAEYTDTDNIISSDYKYPMAVSYTGDDSNSDIDNIEIWGKIKKALGSMVFDDTFTGYTTQYNSRENRARVKGAKVNGITEEGGKVLVTTKEGFDWRTSDVRSINNDTDGYAGIYIKPNCLVGWGYGPQKSTVVLDTKNKKITDIEQVQFQLWVGHKSTRKAEVELFVDEAETKGIIIGIDQDGYGYIDNRGGTSDKKITASKSWSKNNGSASAIFTAEIDKETNSVHVTAVPVNTNDWIDYTFDATYIDTDGIISSDYKYPLAASFAGDYYCADFDNVKIWGKLEDVVLPDFEEKFSNYEGVIENYSIDTQYRLADGKKVLATTEQGYKWVTSEVLNGRDNEGYAYIGKEMNVKGRNVFASAVGLDTGSTKFDMTTVKFNAALNYGARSAGLNLFVGNNEQNYIAFGIANSEGSLYADVLEDNEYSSRGSRIPYIVKCVDGERSKLTATAIQTIDGQAVEKANGAALIDDLRTTGSTINWTIDIDKLTGAITATAVDGNGREYVFALTDTDSIINNLYKFPLEAVVCGDGWGTIDNIAVNGTMTEKEAPYTVQQYSFEQLENMFRAQSYGNDYDVKQVLGLDLRNVSRQKDSITVSIDENNIINSNIKQMTGLAWEATDAYSTFYNEDGTLKQDYVDFARNATKIDVVRIGGTESDRLNYANSLPLDYADRTSSTWVSLPNVTSDKKIGEVSAAPYKMNILETVKVLYANNPNVEIIPCISLAASTPADTVELLKALVGTDSSSIAKRAAFGINAPVKVKYLELMNEADYFFDYENLDSAEQSNLRSWYTTQAKAHINAVKNAGLNVKFMACGPTGLYGTKEAAEPLAKQWVENIGTQIGSDIDSIALHAYYYGITPNMMMLQAERVKGWFDAKANKSVKIYYTEQGSANNKYDDYRTQTSSLRSAMFEMEFINLASKYDWVEGVNHNGRYKNSIGNWWDYAGRQCGEWLTSPYYKATALYNDNIGDASVDVDVTATSRDDTRVSVMASTEDGDLKLHLVNSTDDKDANITFNLGSNYVLTEESILRGPNPVTFTLDSEAEDYVSVTTTQTPANTPLTSYTVPAYSYVVLTAKPVDGLLSFTEKFSAYENITKSNSATISGGEILATDAKGYVWKTSTNKTGYGQTGSGLAVIKKYGSAKIENNSLKVISEVSAENAVNYNNTSLNGIAQISFVLNNTSAAGAEAGVRLFTDKAENSSYKLTNPYADVDVKWTITIADGQLNYVAANTLTNETTGGNIAYTDNDYTYLISVYAMNTTATFDDFNIRYASESVPKARVSYADGETLITVTADPGYYGKSSIDVIGAFYNNGKLVNAEATTVTENKSFAIIKPDSYDSFKLFVWDSISRLIPLDDVR